MISNVCFNGGESLLGKSISSYMTGGDEEAVCVFVDGSSVAPLGGLSFKSLDLLQSITR